MTGRTGAAAERAAAALLACVQTAATLCDVDPPAPQLVACFVNGLTDLVHQPLGRRVLAAAAEPLLAQARDVAARLRRPEHRRYVTCQVALVAAELHRARGQAGAAEAALRAVLGAEQLAPDLEPLVRAVLADLRRVAGDFAAARVLCDEADAALRATTPQAGRVRLAVASVRARLLADIGLPDLALQQLRVVRGLATASGAAEARLEAALVAADVLMAANRGEELVAELTPWLADPAASGAWHGVVRARLGMALALTELATPAGRRLDRDAPDAASELAAALATSDLPVLEQVGAALALARLALKRGDLAQATRHADQAEALLPASAAATLTRGLLALVRCRVARQEPGAAAASALAALESIWEQLLWEWHQTPVRPGGVGFLQAAHRREILGELIHACVAVAGATAGAARAFDHVLAAHAETTGARELAAARPTLAQVRAAAVPPDGGVLVFVPALDVTHVFVLDATTLVHLCVAPPNGLEPWRSDLQAALQRCETAGSGDDVAAALAAGQALAAALFPAPLRARIQAWSALAVSGADGLGRFPLEVLPWRDDALLGEALAVGQLPSLALATALAQRAAPPPGSLAALVVLATEPSGRGPATGLPPLELTAAARARLLASLPGGRVLAGPAASAARLAAALASPVTALVILGHGACDPQRELPVGLALAAGGASDDGVLWPEAVRALPRLPPLVVLAACRAGAGPRRLGDDPLLHLGGACLARGTTCVVAPTGDLELHTTAALLAVFQERLAAGDSPAAALTAARRAVRAAPDGGSARFACVLQAVGLAHRPVTRR